MVSFRVPSEHMKISKDNVYLIAGMVMVVGAFFAASRAIGGVIAILYFATSTDFNNSGNEFAENFANTVNATHVTEAVNGLASFLILFFGGRWIIRGPKLIDRWIDSSRTAGCNDPVSGNPDPEDTNEQAGTGKSDSAAS